MARRPRRSATPVGESAGIDVHDEGPRWVSRAAYKLVGAIVRVRSQGAAHRGRRCLDVGASTGGLHPGAPAPRGSPRVVALDVGHDQLVPEIAAEPRVVDLPRTTIRGLAPDDIGGPVDVLVADLSFISLTLVMETCAGLLADGGDMVVLVKPQFEVRSRAAGQGGHRPPAGGPGLGDHRGRRCCDHGRPASPRPGVQPDRGRRGQCRVPSVADPPRRRVDGMGGSGEGSR
jgi:23S rRNA (cytidine1920-2'-O)/16S rRNA (cytidine1409-2'-O)-methyltransferase